MKIELLYKPSFVRQFDAFSLELQEDVLEAVEQFKNSDNHQKLRVHKLKGSLAGRLSFSVNYRYRIVFAYADKTKRAAILLAIGNHEVYN